MGCGFQYVFLSDMDYFGMKRDAETLGDAIDYSLLESHYVGSGCPAGGVDDYQRLRGPESGPSAGERLHPALSMSHAAESLTSPESRRCPGIGASLCA